VAEINKDIIKERIRSALETQRPEDAVSILLDLHPADQARIFNELDPDSQEILLPLLDIPSTADLLEELEDGIVLETVESLSPERLAVILDEMEPDEAADLLGDLPPDQVSEALAQMEDAAEVIPLLGYPDETAGGLMTTSYIALQRDTTAEQVIEYLRQIHPDNEIPYYLYVVENKNRLIGVIGLRELLVARPDRKMEDIMDHDVHFVTVGSDQEDVARVMARYDLAAIPVVNDSHNLLGVITYDDIVDVLEEEATEDIYRLGNVSDTDLEPESPWWEHLRGRLPWLYLNTATALLASWVVAQFENVISQVAILAAFITVIAGLGGNSAQQSVVMIVRSIALGKMDANKFWRILSKQIWVGLLQGLAIGIVAGIGVTIWRGNPYLGLVIMLAMVANMVIAGLFGTLVPFLITAIGQDPALASSVLVTAATDMFGFFIFLFLSTQFLALLR
jgi:magnesium transporter